MKSHHIVYLLCLCLALLDLLSAYSPIWGYIGFRLWLATIIGFVSTILVLFFRYCLSWRQYNIIYTPLVLFSYGFIALLTSRDPRWGNGESTQQVDCVLKSFFEGIDGGFHSTCMYGYPTRGYLLQAVPSMLFGRSYQALHVGGSLLLLLSLVVFSIAVLERLKYRNGADALVSAFLLLPLSVTPFVNYLVLSDQIILPISFAFLVVGTWLLYEESLDSKWLSLSLLWGLLAANSYPPTLTVYFLFIFWIFGFSILSAIGNKPCYLLCCISLE